MPSTVLMQMAPRSDAQGDPQAVQIEPPAILHEERLVEFIPEAEESVHNIHGKSLPPCSELECARGAGEPAPHRAAQAFPFDWFML